MDKKRIHGVPEAHTRRGVVLCAGLATVDVVHRVTDFPEPNRKVTALRQDVAAGGPATNAAVTAAALGSRVTLLTALGDHPLAGLVAHELAEHGITVRDLDPGRAEPPAVSAIAVHQGSGARNIVSTDAGGADPAPPADLAELAAAADVVLLDGHHPRLALAAAKATGPTVVFDAGRFRPHHPALLAAADVVICSADYRLPDQQDAAATRRRLRELVRFGAVTRGAEPVLWWADGVTGAVPVPAVEARDTLGAGDVFHGAFAHVVAGAGWDPARFAEQLSFAAGIAALRVGQVGPRSWLALLPEPTH